MDASRCRPLSPRPRPTPRVPRIAGTPRPRCSTLTIARARLRALRGLREDLCKRVDPHHARGRARARRTRPAGGAHAPRRRPSREDRLRQRSAPTAAPRCPPRTCVSGAVRPRRSRSDEVRRLGLVRDDCARAVARGVRAVVALVRSDVDDHRAQVVARVRLVDRDEGPGRPVDLVVVVREVDRRRPDAEGIARRAADCVARSRTGGESARVPGGQVAMADGEERDG